MATSQYEVLSSMIDALELKVSNLTEELRSVNHELERQINDEHNDRESADDSMRSDLSSLQHKVDYS